MGIQRRIWWIEILNMNYADEISVLTWSGVNLWYVHSRAGNTSQALVWHSSYGTVLHHFVCGCSNMIPPPVWNQDFFLSVFFFCNNFISFNVCVPLIFNFFFYWRCQLLSNKCNPPSLQISLKLFLVYLGSLHNRLKILCYCALH